MPVTDWVVFRAGCVQDVWQYVWRNLVMFRSRLSIDSKLGQVLQLQMAAV